MTYIVSAAGSISLQATLATTTADDGCAVAPHHPITCNSDLELWPDGRFRCAHAEAPPGDRRTVQAINHSVALLLIELMAAG